MVWTKELRCTWAHCFSMSKSLHTDSLPVWTPAMYPGGTGWGSKLVGKSRIQGFSKEIYLKLKSISNQYNLEPRSHSVLRWNVSLAVGDLGSRLQAIQQQRKTKIKGNDSEIKPH